MPKIVDVKGIGRIAFPDDFSQEAIGMALDRQYGPRSKKTASGIAVPTFKPPAAITTQGPSYPEDRQATIKGVSPDLWERLRYSPAGMHIFGRPPLEQEQQKLSGGFQPSPATVLESSLPFTLGTGVPTGTGPVTALAKGVADLGIASKMAWDTIRGLPSQYDALKKAIHEHNTTEAIRIGLGLGMTAAFIHAGIAGAHGETPAEVPKEAAGKIVNEAQQLEKAAPQYGDELSIAPGAKPGFHQVPEGAQPIYSFTQADIENLLEHKVKSPNAVRAVLQNPNLSDAAVNRALELANQQRQQTGETYATDKIRQQEGGRPEHTGVAPGENIRPHTGEGGQGEGGQAGGGNRPEQPTEVQPRNIPEAPKREVPLSEPVRSFGVDLQTGLRMSTEKAQQTGLAAKSISDLDALAEMRRRAVAAQNDLTERAKKLSDAGDKEGALKLLTQASQRQAQLPREAIESAVNAGGHKEAELEKKLGPRPLDWREHPEVADWLKKNAASLGIALPDELKVTPEPAKPKPTPGAPEPKAEPAILASIVRDPKTGKWVEGPNHPTIEKELGLPETTREQRNNPNYGFKVRLPNGETRELERGPAEVFAKRYGLKLERSEGGQPHSNEVKGETGKPVSEENIQVKPATEKTEPAWAKSLPPVPEGMTRLYHGEEGGAGAGGTFWTTNPEKAAKFGKNVQYLDLTKAELQSARARAASIGRAADEHQIINAKILRRAKAVEGAELPVQDLTGEEGDTPQEQAQKRWLGGKTANQLSTQLLKEHWLRIGGVPDEVKKASGRAEVEAGLNKQIAYNEERKATPGEMRQPESEKPAKGKGARVGKGMTAQKLFDAETAIVGPDIMSWISEENRMMSKNEAKRTHSKEWWSRNKSLYDDAIPLNRKPYHNLIYGGRETPDVVAQEAYRRGLIKEPHERALWAAIRQAHETRLNAKGLAARMEKAIQNEIAQHEDWMRASKEGEHRLNADELVEGDEFEVDGQRVKVIKRDNQTGEITLEDGRRFGIQRLESGDSIYVENYHPEPEGEAEWEPEGRLREEPPEFNLGAPESAEEQRVRLAREEQQRQEREAQRQKETADATKIRKMREKAAAPLGGELGTAGQGTLFTETPQAEMFQPPPASGSQLGGGAAEPGEFPTMPGAGERAVLRAGQALMKFRRTLVAWAQRRGVLDVILHTRDRGDTLATIFAQERGNEIRNEINRNFPKAQRKVAEDALSLAVEAKGDQNALTEMRQKVVESNKASPYWRKRFFDAADFAIYNWDKLRGIAGRYGQMTDAQQFAEESAGLPTLRRSGYVMHVQDQPPSESGLLVPQADGSLGTPFTRVRTHDTFADSIAAGVDPRTINAVDLLKARIRKGQQLINSRAWVESLHNLKAADGTTIAQAPKLMKRADGSSYPVAPEGYKLTYAGFQPIAIRDGYGGIFDALTSPSWFRQHEAMRFFTTANAVGKSINLMFDTFHLGRIAFWQSLIRATNLEAPLPSYRRGLTLIEHSVPEIQRMARNNEIPQSWLPEMLEAKRRLRLALDTGYNIGRVSDALYEDVLHNLPGIGHFNKWLFEQYQRGAMSEVWLTEFARIRKALPDLTEQESARRVSKDLNVRFGNLGRQGWFRSRTAQDAARLVALAPQWNEGLIKSELGALTQTAGYLRDLATGKKLYAGVLMRSVGTMALLTFVANQVINQITRGKFTWENPEEGLGAKLSAWIPDLVGNGPGFFLHPLGLAAETTHLIMNAYERTGNWYDTLQRYLRSRSSAAMRPVLTFVTQKNFLGRTLAPGSVWGEMVKSAIPTPISGSALYAAGKQVITGRPSEQFAGQYQKQALASVGIKTDQAPSPEQRIRALAGKYNRAHNVEPGGEFYTGDYIHLTRAIALGNKNDTANALRNLFATKSVKDLVRYYEHWWRYPFTGQMGRERLFYQTLTPEEKQAYKVARQQRLDISKKALKLIGEYVRAHPPQPVTAQ